MRYALPILLIFTLCGLTLASCGRPATADVDPREFILRSWGTHLILPQYAEFEQDAGALAMQSEEMCAQPDAAHVEDTRQAWRRARTSWKRLEVFGFGPHVEFPARYASMIDFWPARVDTIEETLGSPERIAALEQAGAASRGLPVVEYLLFAPGDASVTVEAFATGEARCDYLIAASRDLHGQATGLHQAWRGEDGYFDTMLNPQDHPEGMFMDRQEALSEVVNRMAFLVDNMRRDKLGKPVGEMTGESSPQSVESRFGAHALADLEANLDMIEWLFQGREDLNTLEDAYWLRDHPRLSNRDAILMDFETNLARVRDALTALEARPLEVSLTQHRQEVIALIELMGEFQRVIQVDIINALSLTRTFNDSDGD